MKKERIAKKGSHLSRIVEEISYAKETRGEKNKALGKVAISIPGSSL